MSRQFRRAVLESVGTPALGAAQADSRFEAESLTAWEEYQLGGEVVGAGAIEGLFGDAKTCARAQSKRRAR